MCVTLDSEGLGNSAGDGGSSARACLEPPAARVLGAATAATSHVLRIFGPFMGRNGPKEGRTAPAASAAPRARRSRRGVYHNQKAQKTAMMEWTEKTVLKNRYSS